MVILDQLQTARCECGSEYSTDYGWDGTTTTLDLIRNDGIYLILLKIEEQVQMVYDGVV